MKWVFHSDDGVALMKVLVTGLSGFTGRYVEADLIRRGHQVVGLGCDLLDTRAVDARVKLIAPDAVIHLAAIAFVAHSDVRKIYDVNVVGTRNLLSALANLGAGLISVVVASSANIYGMQEGRLAENCPPNPQNDYAVSKLAMEHVARLWFDRLPISIVRPFNYTGVGQDHSFLVPKIVNHFRRRKTVIELGNLDVSRDFSDVRDVATVYGRLLDFAPAIHNVYNCCSGVAVELGEIIRICERLSGHHVNVKVKSEFVRSNEIRYLCGDNDKVRNALGFSPEFSLEQTLEWMLLTKGDI